MPFAAVSIPDKDVDLKRGMVGRRRLELNIDNLQESERSAG